MHISTFFRALDIVSSCTYSTPLAFSSSKLSAFVSRSFPLYRPYLRRLISSGQHLGHTSCSLKLKANYKDYFANIFSFPSKSWQIWLLLCLRIATVVKWEKEMKDFWLQIAKPSIHLSLLEKIYKPFSGWKCWKNQTGSLIGLWFTFMWEFGNTCTACHVLFSQIKETKSFEGQNQYRMMGAEERKADAEIFWRVIVKMFVGHLSFTFSPPLHPPQRKRKSFSPS